MDSTELLKIAFIFVCTHWIINKISKARVCMICNRDEMYARKELWDILNKNEEEENDKSSSDEISEASTEEMSVEDLDSMLNELKEDD